MHRVRLGLLCLCIAFGPGIAVAAATTDAPAALAGEVTITTAALEALAAGRRHAEDDGYAVALRRLEAQHRRSLDLIARQTLEQAIDDTLLARAASEAGHSPAELLGGIAVAPPSEAAVAAFYEARREQIGAPLQVVADAIRNRLAEEARAGALQEFRAGLRSKYGARVLLEPLRETIPGEGPTRGPATAAVTIVEFADFQCPFCVRAEPELTRVLERYPAEVRLVFRNLPLTNLHAEAERAAEAAVCAAEQHRFWEFHDGLFATAGQFDAATLLDTATHAGADRKTMTDCLHSGRAVSAVRSDVAAADDLGIAGTPALFINGRLLSGPLSFDTIAATVDDELRRLHDAKLAAQSSNGR